jgi:hypothetical protein
VRGWKKDIISDCKRVSMDDSLSSLIVGGTFGPEGEKVSVSRSFDRAVAAAVCTVAGELTLRAFTNAFRRAFWNAGGDTVSLSG